MQRILYLAYGSNLDAAQMRRRCPEAAPLGKATLMNHELAFHGYSGRWGGGVATVRRRRGRQVDGLVYALTPEDVRALDRCEGVDLNVYVRVRRFVRCWDGRNRRVETYTLQRASSKLRTLPSVQYVTHIWCAYARLGFDRGPLLRAFAAAR